MYDQNNGGARYRCTKRDCFNIVLYQYREGFVKAFPNKSDHCEAQLESEEKQLSKDKIQTN